MNVHRVIDNGVVYSTITGEISLAGIKADMARLAADSSYDPSMPGIVDMRAAHAAFTADDIVALTEMIKHSPKVVSGARRALLVATEEMYGIYRMFESFSTGGTVVYRVFRDEQEARKWIESAQTAQGAASDTSIIT